MKIWLIFYFLLIIMTLLEAKAKAYDILSQIEYLKNLLQETNQNIARLQQEEQQKEETLPAKK